MEALSIVLCGLGKNIKTIFPEQFNLLLIYTMKSFSM